MLRNRVNLFPQPEGPKRFILFNWLMVFIVAAGVLLLATHAAQAADVLPQAPLATGSIGGTVVPQTIEPGVYHLGVGIDSRSGVHDGSEASSQEVNRHQRLSVGAGFAFGATTDLHVSVHGLHESSGSGEANQQFNGVGLLVRQSLVDQGRIGLALIPYLHYSGEDKQGNASLASPRRGYIGWLLAGSIGEPGLASAFFNFGYRYRPRDQWESLYVQNEMTYRAAVVAWVSRQLTLSVAYDGRSVQREKDRGEDSLTQSYEAITMGEATFGIGWQDRRNRVELYAGKGFGDEVNGHGDSMFGIRWKTTIGEPRRQLAERFYHRPEPTVSRVEEKLDEDEKELVRDELDEWMSSWKGKEKADEKDSEPGASQSKRQDDLTEKAASKGKSDKDAPQADLFSGEPVDFYDQYEEAIKDVLADDQDSTDWFKLRKQLEQERKDPEQQKPAREELIETELNELRETQRKREESEKKQRQIEMEQQRLRERQLFEEEQRLLERYRRELQRELQELPQINNDESGWDGLY